jgi:hypothetical protein
MVCGSSEKNAISEAEIIAEKPNNTMVIVSEIIAGKMSILSLINDKSISNEILF